MLKRIKQFNLSLEIFFWLILIFVPLFPKFPFIRVPGTFVSIRLEDLIMMFAFVAVGKNILSDFNNFIKSKLNKAFILFFLVGLISLLSGIFLTNTVSGHIGFLHWARRVEYIFPFFIGYYLFRRGKISSEKVIKVLSIIIIYAFVYGVLQKYFQLPIIVTQNDEYAKGVALYFAPGSHLNSTFAGHYDLATYLVFLLPVILSSFLLIKDRLGKLVFFTSFIGGLWLLVNSASRVSLVSYLVSCVIALVIIKKYKFIPILVLISILMSMTSANLLARYQRIFKFSADKVKNLNIIYENKLVPSVLAQENTIRRDSVTPTPTPIPIFEDRSSNIRLNVEWPRAIRAFIKNPLLGTGYSSITLATDNDYLRMIGETGILGTLAFLIVIGRLILNYLKRLPFLKYYKKYDLAIIAGTFSSLAGVFTNAFFIDVFEASKFAISFWLIIGVVTAKLYNNE